MISYSETAVQSVLESKRSYCKFLSANDSGATGAHQAGILISKSALEMMFNKNVLNEHTSKRIVRIKWQDDITTESCFTWYGSKNELRITRLGRGFPYRRPDMTGALFVFTQQEDDVYHGYVLETEDEIDYFLNFFGITPVETNRPIRIKETEPEVCEATVIQKFIADLTVDFPDSFEMSQAARFIDDLVRNHTEYVKSDPDTKLLNWTETEYTLFRALEYTRYSNIIQQGFPSVEEFVILANQVLNRRKSRAGKSLEHHLAAIFDANALLYSAQAKTEGHKRPDFIFPSEKAYHTASFPEDRLIVLAAKTTCKDRWRQILNEADRLKNKTKYLCTLQPGISADQLTEMKAEGVQLVVPKQYIPAYPPEKQSDIWTLKTFIEYVKELETL